MLPYSQSNRLMKVTTPLGPDAILLFGLQGREAISELFRFELELLADKRIPVPFDKLLGQPIGVELILPNGLARRFHGIVSRFGQGRRDDTFTHYRAEMVPKFWLWTRRTASRVFQRKSTAEILSEVLDGLDFTLELSDDYPRRDYTAQYRETDFAFASRLMEEEGIRYYFRHHEDRHELVLSDNPLRLPEVSDPATVIYEAVAEGLRDDVRVTEWDKSQEICSSQYTLWDHCFELPGQNLEAVRTVPQTMEVGSVEHKLPGCDEMLEVYDYPGGYARWFDGVDPGGSAQADDLSKIFEENDRTATIRMQEQVAGSVRIEGRSNCVHFVSGHQFGLSRHVNGDGKYLLTAVEHNARLSAGYRSGEDGGEMEYENRFRCIAEKVSYRPPRVTPRPIIAGVQTATVVGPEGEELFVDKYGRVKVQFHWDRRGERNADSSCWIRVGQIWAGPTWGAFFWPRIGHEVIVAFAEGDPDQPIIVGSVYNAENMPHPHLPDEKMIAGIKSKIFSGDPATKFNAILFHDSPEAEFLQMHSETNEVNNAEVNKFHYVPQGQFTFHGSFPS